MELEHRLQNIEQEVVLLKAQIQSTLLDIQEQLLTNKYPALRNDDVKAHNRMSPPAPATLPEMSVTVPQEPVVRRVETPAEATYAGNRQTAPEPSYANNRQVAADPLDLPSRPLVTNEDWTALAKIARWMSAKSDELGSERMRALIKMYAQKQDLAPEVMESLLQFMSLYGDEASQIMVNMPRNGRASKTMPPSLEAFEPLEAALVASEYSSRGHIAGTPNGNRSRH